MKLEDYRPIKVLKVIKNWGLGRKKHILLLRNFLKDAL